MACSVTVNQHGVLTFRIYFEGQEKWKSTGKPDTAENRREVEALAVIISKGIKEKTFSWDWFQDEAVEEPKPDNKTVGRYYAEWIERKKPPVVRAGSSGITKSISIGIFSADSETSRLSISLLACSKNFALTC